MYRISNEKLDSGSMVFFTNAYKSRGITPTGELLEVLDENWNCVMKRVVFTGGHTAYDTVRDCGDHYIIARHDRYDRIDKATMQVTKDVPDR